MSERRYPRMSGMQRDLYFAGLFLLVMWLVYIVDAFIPYAINGWGIQPRRLTGLIGIPLMPILHNGFFHVFSNTISLGILMFLLVTSQKNHWPIMVAIVLLNGLLVWLFGRSEINNVVCNHIGASGLAFGLIGFLILNGFLEKRLISIGVALLVGFFFGSTLISGIIPSITSNVSWEGHFFGVVAGAVVAYVISEQKNVLAWRR